MCLPYTEALIICRGDPCGRGPGDHVALSPLSSSPWDSKTLSVGARIALAHWRQDNGTKEGVAARFIAPGGGRYHRPDPSPHPSAINVAATPLHVTPMERCLPRPANQPRTLVDPQ